MRSSAGQSPSPVLVVALLVALAAGAAASLIIGAATAPNAPPPRASELILPQWFLTACLVGFLLSLLAWGAYRRISERRMGLPSRTLVTFLFAFLVAIMFLVAAQFFLGGTLTNFGGTNAPPSHGNSTGTTPPSNQSLTNGTNVGNASSLLLPGLPGIPGWVPLAVVAGVVLIVAALVLPAVRAYAADRRASRIPRVRRTAEVEAVQDVLRTAQRDLDLGGDPRDVIVRLYGQLLERLGRVVGSVDPNTPEEIRTLHLVRLGIRPTAATELTRLFEEARYSSHALGTDALGRAQTAVRESLSDLDRSREAA
jgi:hypothetical protein